MRVRVGSAVAVVGSVALWWVVVGGLVVVSVALVRGGLWAGSAGTSRQGLKSTSHSHRDFTTHSHHSGRTTSHIVHTSLRPSGLVLGKSGQKERPNRESERVLLGLRVSHIHLRLNTLGFRKIVGAGDVSTTGLSI